MAILALLLTAPDARAGTYIVTYSGGIFSNSGDKDPYTESYAISSANSPAGSYGDFGGNTADYYGDDTPADVGGSGEITATFTWQPGHPGEQPPSCAILQQNSDVSAGSDGTGTGSLNDSLGETASVPEPGGSELKKTLYTLKSSPGSTFQVKCSPSADSGGTFADVDASVGYTVAAYPVTVSMVGAQSDGKGGWDILVGQKCGPFLYGIPAACTISNYQWSVTGTTMQSWTVSSDSTHTTEVDGPGSLNIQDPAWYWNDPKQTSETISCTATVTPPAGQGNPFTVTASQAVGVYLPHWTASGSGGTMDVRLVTTPTPNGNVTGYGLTSDPLLGSGQAAGMNWVATLAPPSPSPVTFDKGNIYLVQLVTPSEEYYMDPDQIYVGSDQGQIGLDTSWPYDGGWQIYEDDPDRPNYVDNDDPGIDLSTTQAIYGNDLDSFVDYIMYQPDDSPEYVPLGYFKWSLHGTAIIPSTNNWANFKNPAGIIEPSGSAVPFTPSNSYPSWTQNSGNKIVGWKPE